MVLKRNSKGNKFAKSNSYASVPIDLNTLNIFAKYCLSSSSYIKITHLNNVRKLMKIVNPDLYQNDIEKVKRVKLINLLLEARLDYKLTNFDMIISHIETHRDFELDFIDPYNCQLSKDELDWCRDIIVETLEYAFVYKDIDRILDLGTQIKSSNFNNKGNLINEFEEAVDDIKNKFRKVKSADNLVNLRFSLRDEPFEESVAETYRKMTDPSNILQTGMQGLNQMLGGGFEAGRVYMFLGIAGVGKSMLLLNLMYQLRMYNTHYRTKDPTKDPCIVMLTMENSVMETISRLFNIIVQGKPDMRNYTLKEVVNILKVDGKLVLDHDMPIDMIIMYKANRSVDTSYLYDLDSDLADDNYEMICLLQDHVKRIRSSDDYNDYRLELGAIVNEFKTFAEYRQIPIITDGHLNREAARIIEEQATKSNQIEIGMRLGKSNTGESLLMIDNLDFGFTVNIDYDDQGNKYITINSIKHRDKVQRTYVAHPFCGPDSPRLVEDLGKVPAFKDYLHLNSDINRVNTVKTSPVNSNLIENNTPKSVDVYGIPEYEDEDEEEKVIVPTKPIDIVPKIQDALVFEGLNKISLEDINEFKRELI